MDDEWQEAISTSTTTTTKITMDEKKPTEQSNNKEHELIQQEQQSQQQKIDLITSRHHPFYNNNNNNNNNIQHVAPVGVLIVLFTLYITATALQRNYINHNSNNNKNLIKSASNIPEENQSKWLLEQKRQESVQNRLMEHDHVCMDLEVFTKSVDEDDYDVHDEWLDEISEVTNNVNEEHLEGEVDNLASQEHHNENSNGLNGKQSVQRRRSLKRKHGHRNGVNGGHHHHRHHHNRSVNKLSKAAEKKTEALKKEPKEAKKSTTAEPIIYLFALVFIYLLLKAASDINQHYKSQSKGDKRLRRCSLQSYAQTHKQDRRASKGISSKNLPKF